MPYFRLKLLPESKTVLKQKRWSLFRVLPWARLYMNMRTPINMKKEKALELQRALAKLTADIAQMEKEYDAMVKNLKEKPAMRDKDGGGLTQWKFEPLPWWKFSIFQWAIPFVDEPPEFDPAIYRGGGRKAPQRKRPKDMDIAVNALREDGNAFRKEMEEGTPDGDGDRIPIASFTPGDGDRGMQKRKGEDDAHFKQRKEEAKGKLEGDDIP